LNSELTSGKLFSKCPLACGELWVTIFRAYSSPADRPWGTIAFMERGRGEIPEMTRIDRRTAEINVREVPGHWVIVPENRFENDGEYGYFRVISSKGGIGGL
jgi:hypothetical protein